MRPKPNRTLRWLLIGVALALLLAGATRTDWRSVLDRGSAPEPAATTISAATDGVHGVFIEPQDGLSPVMDEIDAARRSIDVEVYLFSSDEIVAALKRAKGRGVTVRIIIERQPFQDPYDKSIAKARLESNGFKVRFGSSRYTYTHAKFIVVDGQTGVILTANFTRAAFTGNRDLGVVTTYPNEIADLQAIFEADWNDQPTPAVRSLIVSPTNARAEMSALVASATKSIDIYAEEMFDDAMVKAFIAAEQRGVAVRILVPSSNDPDQAAQVAKLLDADAEVRLLDSPTLHAKMILADGMKVFVGSQNMSANSIDHNREVGLILTEPANVTRLDKAFQRDFSVAPVWSP